MLPVVVTYSLPAGNATSIAATQPATSLAISLTTTVVGSNQRRITVNSTLNDTGIFFKIIGLNQANNTISELLTGAGTAAVATSNLDYSTVISITPSTLTGSIATTAGTVSVGLNAGGSSLWNIVNWHSAPTTISVGCIVQSTNTGVNYTVQYTYDDPNNLASGISFPTPFNHSTLVSQTASLDGQITGPVTAVRLLVNSGTGVMRMVMTQVGLASP